MERSHILGLVRIKKTYFGSENGHYLRTSQSLGFGFRPRRSRQLLFFKGLVALRKLPCLASSLLRVPIFARVFGERCSRTTRPRSHVFVSVVS
jgi:hypothetical protein